MPRALLLPAQLCLFLALSSCLQTENSSSLDEFAGGEGVKGVFSDRCASCHDNFIKLTDEEFVTQGLVVPGDPESSPIYYRLAGSSGSEGPKDMPLGASLTASEIELVRVWIEEL